jgi:hypothetical protein
VPGLFRAAEVVRNLRGPLLRPRKNAALPASRRSALDLPAMTGIAPSEDARRAGHASVASLTAAVAISSPELRPLERPLEVLWSEAHESEGALCPVDGQELSASTVAGDGLAADQHRHWIVAE